jgi:hypothetical protein
MAQKDLPAETWPDYDAMVAELQRRFNEIIRGLGIALWEPENLRLLSMTTSGSQTRKSCRSPSITVKRRKMITTKTSASCGVGRAPYSFQQTSPKKGYRPVTRTECSSYG